MNEKNFDLKIKETLMKKTDEAAAMKEELKQKLEQRLFSSEVKKTSQKKKNKKGKIAFFISVAATVMISVGIQTEAGYAFVDKIKNFFAPEKEIIQSIEGNKESADVQLQEGKKLNYVIYVDEERYRFNEDTVTTKVPLGENYPEVFMKISQEENKSVEKVIAKIESDVKSKGYVMAKSENVTYPKEGYLIYAVANEHREWNTPVEKYFILKEKENKVFVFKQVIFVEAEEGHGVRFDEMIKEFHVIK